MGQTLTERQRAFTGSLANAVPKERALVDAGFIAGCQAAITLLTDTVDPDTYPPAIRKALTAIARETQDMAVAFQKDLGQ